jgi:hypothetical protein
MPFSLRRRRVRLRHRDLTPDRYLTDGLRLLRVLSRFVNDGSVLVVLEDCATLDAHALAAVELVALGMRPVRRAKLPSTEPPSSPVPGEPLETDTHAVA